MWDSTETNMGEPRGQGLVEKRVQRNLSRVWARRDSLSPPGADLWAVGHKVAKTQSPESGERGRRQMKGRVVQAWETGFLEEAAQMGLGSKEQKS